MMWPQMMGYLNSVRMLKVMCKGLTYGVGMPSSYTDCADTAHGNTSDGEAHASTPDER